ncbi:MAG: ABC transporter permease, partial [Clostridium sp.]
MKSYKGLVSRYIKNEKRSVIPIFISIVLTISVIISVTFITKNIVENDGETKKILYGDYDIRLQKINSERLDKIKKNENIKDFTLGKSNEALAIESVEKNTGVNYKEDSEQEKVSNNANRLELIDEYAVEKRFLDEYLNFKIIDGRLPENDNEIILDKSVINMLPENSKVGSIIEFSIMQTRDNRLNKINDVELEGSDEEVKEKEESIKKAIEEQRVKENEEFKNSKKVNYKIVGIIEIDKADILFGNKIIRLLTSEEIRDNTQEFEAFAYLNDSSKEAEIAKELGLKYIKPGVGMTSKYGYESSDIKYPGYDKGDYSSIINNGLSKTILSIAIIFCFLAVYNTFQASIANRIKIYGILRAIGGSMGQIRYLIYFESLILYIVAIPIGVLLGYFITWIESYVLINYLGLLEKFNMTINLEVVIISTISTLFILLLSIRIILKKEGKLTPIEAIVDARGLNRACDKVKNDKNSYDEERYIKELLDYEKTTVKFKIMRKLFKFEGELAQKNITRDIKTNKLSKVTIFIAMSISIFFFLQIVNATVNGKSLIKTNKWDVEIKLKGQDYKESVINEIKAVNGVEDVYKYSKRKAAVVVPGEALSRNLKDLLVQMHRGSVKDGGVKGITANIIGLDEKTLNLYKGVSKEKLDAGG